MMSTQLNEHGKIPGPGRYRTVGGGTVWLRYYNPIANVAAPWGGTYWEPGHGDSHWHSWDEEGRSVSGQERMDLVLPENDRQRVKAHGILHDDGTVATVCVDENAARAWAANHQLTRVIPLVELRDGERIYRPNYRASPSLNLQIGSSGHGGGSNFQPGK